MRVQAKSKMELWVSSTDYLKATSLNKQPSINDDLIAESPLGKTDYLTWLCTQPAANKTLQLASFKESSAVDTFLLQHPEVKNEDLHRAKSFDQNWHYLLYGSYATQVNADQQMAKINLPRASMAVRSFKYLQAKRCSDGLLPSNEKVAVE
ncbi:MAG: hypothetical protein ACI9FR_003246 [Cryomorphaceae bacterium]